MALSSFLQKLLFINQFNIKEGKIDILGNRYVMLDSSYLTVLQDIDRTKAYNVAKDSSKSSLKKLVNHAEVYKNVKVQSIKNIAQLSKKIAKNEEGVIKTIREIFNIYGLGRLEIVNLDNEKKTVLLTIENSSIALTKLEKGKSKEEVCSFTAGFLAGIFSFIFKKDVECIEEDCLAKGSKNCRFRVE